MKVVACGIVAVLLTACASLNAVDPEVASDPRVKLRQGPNGYQYLDSFSMSFEASTGKSIDALPVCVARSVQNRGVTVSETSAHVGSYTGKTYWSSSTSNIAGGEVLKYVSDDRASVSAEGSVVYSIGSAFAPIDRSVRFALNATKSAQLLTLQFTKLEQVQIQSAGAASGYTPAGAWSGADPEKVISALASIGENINACLSQ